MKLLQRPSLSDLVGAVRGCIPTPSDSIELPEPSRRRLLRPPLICNRVLNGVRLTPYFVPPRTLNVAELRLALEHYAITGDFEFLTTLYDEQATGWLFPPGKPHQHYIATLLWAISRMAQLPLKFAPNSVWVESDTFFVGVVNGAMNLRFTKGLTVTEFNYRKSLNDHSGIRPVIECKNKEIMRFWIALGGTPQQDLARKALSLLYCTVKDRRLLAQALYEGRSLK